MTDPYKVLGVSPSASDEEIKKAYRALVKQYHPDNYTDNPLADLAAEKMKAINEAYDEIQKLRAGGSSYSQSGRTGSSGGSTEFAQVRNLINGGNLSEAERLLNSTPVAGRTAEWHFLKGAILYRNGWVQDARTEIDLACSMDPYNNEYRTFQQRMNSGSDRSPYGNAGQSAAGNCDACDICSALMCLNCLCGGSRCTHGG